MRRNKKLLALLLSLVVLYAAAMPSFAQSAFTPKLMQASSATKLYSGPGGAVSGEVQKGAVVLALGEGNGYYQVQREDKTGYIAADKLRTPDSGARVEGVVRFTANVNTYAGADTKSEVTGKLISGSAAARLLTVTINNATWIAVRQGNITGFVSAANTAVYTRDTKPIASFLVTASSSIKSGSAPNDIKLASASKGELLDVLYNGGGYLIVKKGGVAGILPAANGTLYDDGTIAESTVVAKANIKLLAGTGGKAASLTSVKKGAGLEKLGVYGSHTVVRYNGVIGLVASKNLKAAQDAAGTTQTMEDATSAAPQNGYVYATADAPVYSEPSAGNKKLAIIKQGTTMKALGVGGGFVKIEVGKVTGYMEGKYLAQSPVVPLLDATGYDYSKQTDGLELIASMNAYRKKSGLKALQTDAILMKAAEIRVKEIAQYFSHTRPNGLGVNSIDIDIASENMARGVGKTALKTARDMAEGFMGSSAHMQNAMNSSFTKTGAACLRIGDATYWVQLFS
ncbi:MAG: CAP domain-containing protein [Clostridiales bacterium]|jgi:uncharacterized protein YkwD|nr:CAP domain-containing protein [Clostridiales bacterium]